MSLVESCSHDTGNIGLVGIFSWKKGCHCIYVNQLWLFLHASIVEWHMCILQNKYTSSVVTLSQVYCGWYAVLKAGIKASKCELSLFGIVMCLTNLIIPFWPGWSFKFTLENIVILAYVPWWNMFLLIRGSLRGFEEVKA